MFDVIDSSIYKYSDSIYIEEFKVLLQKIVICYYLMLGDNLSLKNDENQIRDRLLIGYLKNNFVRERLKLKGFLFDREVPEDKSPGRTDIKIQTMQSFDDTEAYYIIECKRIDCKSQNGTSGLNAKYIENGIMRFIIDKYSCYYRLNGMIGFVVESMDIDQNVNCLNDLIYQKFPETQTIQNLQREGFIENFEFLYSSKHNTVENTEILLYHLMLDFSGNIRHH